MSRSWSWKRGLGEGAVIVVSVLLALAADAWLERRQAAELEAHVLAAVAEEAAANRAVLRDHLEFVGAMQDRADRFLRSSSATLSVLPVDSLRPFAEALQRPQTFDALTAAASLLSATPVLSSENVEIRSLVSAFLTEVEDAVEEREEFRQASRAIRTHLTRYAARASRGGAGTVGEMLGRLGPDVLAEMREDDQLVELLVERSTILTLYTYDLERLAITLEALSNALEARSIGGAAL